MIEGGGLGVFAPEDVGPVTVQVPNGVVDVLAADETDAVDAARATCRTSRADVGDWTSADQELLREVVPRDRRRVYDVRRVVEPLADEGSVLELRPAFGARHGHRAGPDRGSAVGVIANNPMHLAGAIDADGADKAARFMQLCDAFGLPLLFLCDTPGFMVGPRGRGDRPSCAMSAGCSWSAPAHRAVRCRRAAQGLRPRRPGDGRGQLPPPVFTVAWPTGELGGMGLEGAVRLGFRRELDPIDDPEEREAAFAAMVARAYEHGKALNVAAHFEIDDVIDPARTRARLRARPRIGGSS